MCIRDSITAAPVLVPYYFTLSTGQGCVTEDSLFITVNPTPVSYTHLRAHETVLDLVCRLLLEKKKTTYRYDTHLIPLTNI